jgi:hypothetical protein
MDSDGRRLAHHLVEAERHVSDGERLVEHQRRTIEKRRRDGHHTELAMQLLEEMEESLRLHVQDLDRLRQEMASSAQPECFIKRPPWRSQMALRKGSAHGQETVTRAEAQV